MVKKVPELTSDEEKNIRKEVESFKIEGDLRREKQLNIKRIKDIKSYKGVRHIKIYQLEVKDQNKFSKLFVAIEE